MPSIAIFAIEIAHQLVIDFQTFILSWPLSRYATARSTHRSDYSGC